MTRLIVDAAVRAKLCDLAEPLVLCDEHGKIIGHFVPAIDLSQWEPISPGASDEELDRRMRSNERRYTTAEVFARLESIAHRESS